MKLWSLILIFAVAPSLFGQGGDEGIAFENQLKTLVDNLRAQKSDSMKIVLSRQIVNDLKSFYKTDLAFNYHFTKIKTIGFINSPDHQLKIVNWNVEKKDQSNQYFGIVVRAEKKKGIYTTYELDDTSNPFEAIPTGYVYNDNWYGALYYDIIPMEKRGKTIYTLLGYDANNKNSHIKLIDAMSFVGHRIKFGNSIFYEGKKSAKRVLFEHSKKSVMSLRYDAPRQRIVFDHLSPENPVMADFREFYVPDMSYDAFKFDNGRWELQQDVVAINDAPSKKKKKQTVTVYDLSKKGDLVSSSQKETWIDPTDKNAPAGGNVHTPAMPEAPSKKALKEQKQQKSQTRTMDQYHSPKASKQLGTESYYQAILGKKHKKRNKK